MSDPTAPALAMPDSVDKEISPWLAPLAGFLPAGPDLEYDPAFLELAQAVHGRPETQFGPAEPPSWPLARERAQALFLRTRDLRVAMAWGRAVVNLEGLEGLAPALELLHGLLVAYPEDLHPRPDADDSRSFVRLGVLAGLDALDGLLGDVRQAPLVMDRRMGGIRVRECEVALGRLPPRAHESVPTPGQIEGMLGDLPHLAERLRSSVAASLHGLQRLREAMEERFGPEDAIATVQMHGMLAAVQSLVPGPTGADGTAQAVPAAASAPAQAMAAVDSRQDALRAIRLVCAYLDRSEPTNPAQLLLRRAERLIDKTFLQVVQDLAPDAAAEVARILGVAPDEA